MRPKLIANTPVGPPTPPSPGFKYCADEGKTCRYTGKEKMMRVAFGSSEKFKYKYINIPKQGRSVSCNSYFQLFNSTGRNRCYVMGLALDPSPTPIPTPTPMRVTPITRQNTVSGSTPNVTPVKTSSEPIYLLQSVNKCVEVNETGNYSLVKLSKCNDSRSQKWVFVESPNSPGYGEIRTFGNKCLASVAGAGEDSGYAATVGDCTGFSSQRWRMTASGELRVGNRCLNSNTGGKAFR